MQAPAIFVMLRRMSRFSFLFFFTLLLSACGFHLRGHYPVPSFLHEITLRTAPGSEAFETEMRLALERNNIVPHGGDILLDVTKERLNRQTSTVDSHAKAAEYTLIYTVEFRIGGTDGKVRGPLQSLILRRSYQYSATNVAGKSTEEETLVHELRMDAAQQILRQLTALKTSPLAEDGSTAAPPQ